MPSKRRILLIKRLVSLKKHRTVDQMVQAARSGKQNIVEGSEDGKTSTAMELNLLNVALTLCFQVDTMMNKYLKKVEEIFVKEGGVKERMHRARTEYRKQQDERLAELERRVPQLEQQLQAAQTEAAQWKAAYEDLKQRALKAYYRQQEEIKALKQQLGV